MREIARVVAAAGLDDALDAAMDVFNVLAHLRRRERELSGLYATARELTTLRSIDEVLQSIAERAQGLVPSADASYIAVREEDGGVTVRASVGLTSPVFKQIHTRPGTGMAALIARTGSPLWVRRYTVSDEIDHDPVLDAALAEDQLVSVLGVPLKIRNEVIGVLYAANRFERPPSSEESVLLGAFADHAAVALENARLFGQLDAARRAAQEDAETIRRSAELHDRLTQLVLQGPALRMSRGKSRRYLTATSACSSPTRENSSRRSPKAGTAVTPSRRMADTLWLSEPPQRGLEHFCSRLKHR